MVRFNTSLRLAESLEPGQFVCVIEAGTYRKDDVIVSCSNLMVPPMTECVLRIFQVCISCCRTALSIPLTVALGAYGMAVGDKDYDWSYHTVGFLRRLVTLLTIGSGSSTESE